MSGMIDTLFERRYGQILTNRWIWLAVIVYGVPDCPNAFFWPLLCRAVDLIATA
jgi:hypothetical protein